MTKYIPLTQGKVAIVDDADYDLLSKFKWQFVKNSKFGTGYAVRTVWNESHDKRIALAMHNAVMVPPEGLVVDHVYGNQLDNRKSNLRITTREHNAMNLSTPRNNTSGFKGVKWQKSDKRWIAYIGFQNRAIYLGCFSDIKDAIAARQVAELRYFGKYRRI